MNDRDYKISLRLDRTEAKRLERLSRETATTLSVAIRVLIRNTEPAQLERPFQLEQR
jgi:hypothetical protein